VILLTQDKIRLQIANSPLHGKGLFARGFIKQGTLLGKIKGIHTVRDDSYVLWLTEFSGVRMLCKYKYINHSATPNVILYDTLEVCALRDIHHGDEITHDYGRAEWSLDVAVFD
jgi:SET domain-containing protein